MGRGTASALVAFLLLLPACATHRVAAPPAPLPSAQPSLFWSESFDEINPERWREVEVRRHTQYEAVDLNGRRCLRVASLNGASILLQPIRFDAHTYEWLSWDWRVDQPVEKEALSALLRASSQREEHRGSTVFRHCHEDCPSIRHSHERVKLQGIDRQLEAQLAALLQSMRSHL